MKTINYILLGITSLLFACNGKKGELDKQEISALSIIKGQINHLDTSLYLIKKIETTDGKSDSSFLKREEIRTLASDFLSLPDITEKKFKEKYTEEKLIDNSQNTLSIIYTLKDDNLELKKQIIFIPLDEMANGKVNSIYFDRSIVKNDSIIEQKLFWQLDKYFQVGTIITKKNLPEKVKSMKVTWE